VLDESNVQRNVTTDLIKNHPNLTLEAEFNNATEAKQFVEDNEIDIFFIAVEMASGSCFEFLDVLTVKPEVIFIASDTKFAFRAFEYDGIDYLQRPIKKDRFLYAVEKGILRNKITNEPEIELGEFIFVKSNLKKRKVYLNSLKYIQALGDYVKLITNDETLVVLSTMKSFENSLPNEDFKRIHKSYIVNISKITRYNSKAVELEKEVLPLSRKRKSELINSLNLRKAVF
jgi:DNA-binding LytR/AlgR family response regulator